MPPVDPIEVYSPHCQCENHGERDQAIALAIEAHDLDAQLRAETPYPQFCMQPLLCAGEGYCKRDPCCID